MVQTYGLLKYVVDTSLNGEYAGWTKGRNKSTSNVRTLARAKFGTELDAVRMKIGRKVASQTNLEAGIAPTLIARSTKICIKTDKYAALRA